MDELPVAEALLVRVELADKDLHSHRGNNTRKRRSVLTEQPTCGHSHWGAPTMVQVQATVLCREEQGSAGHTCKSHNPSLHRTTLTPNPTRGKLNDAERHQGSTHLVGMAEEVGEGVRAAVRLAEGVVVDDTDAKCRSANRRCIDGHLLIRRTTGGGSGSTRHLPERDSADASCPKSSSSATR